MMRWLRQYTKGDLLSVVLTHQFTESASIRFVICASCGFSRGAALQRTDSGNGYDSEAVCGSPMTSADA